VRYLLLLLLIAVSLSLLAAGCGDSRPALYVGGRSIPAAEVKYRLVAEPTDYQNYDVVTVTDGTRQWRFLRDVHGHLSPMP
jgi:hypothetical protein